MNSAAIAPSGPVRLRPTRMVAARRSCCLYLRHNSGALLSNIAAPCSERGSPGITQPNPSAALSKYFRTTDCPDVPGDLGRFSVPAIAALTAQEPDHAMRLRLISPCARRQLGQTRPTRIMLNSHAGFVARHTGAGAVVMRPRLVVLAESSRRCSDRDLAIIRFTAEVMSSSLRASTRGPCHVTVGRTLSSASDCSMLLTAALRSRGIRCHCQASPSANMGLGPIPGIPVRIITSVELTASARLCRDRTREVAPAC